MFLNITNKSKEGITLERKITLSWEEFKKYFKISEDNLKAIVLPDWEEQVQAYLDKFDKVKKNLIKDAAYIKVAEKRGLSDLGVIQKMEDVNMGYNILIIDFGFQRETIDKMIKKAVDRRVDAIMTRIKEGRSKFKRQTQRLGDLPAFAKLKAVK